MKHIYKEIHHSPQPTKGNIVMVHGAGEHCGRYHHVIKAFNDAGYDCYTGDLPGHGRSSGKRGHVNSFDQYVDAVKQWVEDAMNNKPSIPTFLFGHSMGGLIATYYVLKYPNQDLQGLALSSPFYKLLLELPQWKKVASKILVKMAPSLAIPSGVNGKHVSRDIAVIEAYDRDQLNVSVVTPKWHKEIEEAIQYVNENVHTISLPVCIVQAGQDKLVDPYMTKSHFERISSQDKTLEIWEQSFHELLNEPEKKEVMQFLIEWFDRHI